MIDIRNLSFGYRRTSPLFEELSLTLSPGSIYGLLGKNGAGKTSLLKILSGLLFPLSGTCSVCGFTPRLRKPSFLERLYFLPEDFHLPPVSIQKYTSLHACFYPGFNAGLFSDTLVEFDLKPLDRLDRLSHGQRKKFLIAFGLGTECPLLLMDEPTNGLDIPGKSAFRRLIAAAIRDDRTVVISTHQVRDVENLIDSVVVLERGRILFHRSLPEITAHLLFSSRMGQADVRAVLHTEETPLGRKSVLRNPDGEDSAVDLEALFNAVIHHPEAVGSAFGKESEGEI
jgi:ABC-2 type transport system ATP-binding protein